MSDYMDNLEKMNLYPEMNDKIADLLGMSEEPMYLYTAEYIKQLRKETAEQAVRIADLEDTVKFANNLYHGADRTVDDLHAQLSQVTAELEKVKEINKALESDNYNAELNLSHLTAELEKANARADKAVADMRAWAAKSNEPCWVCKYYTNSFICRPECDGCGKNESCKFVWRGLEEHK